MRNQSWLQKVRGGDETTKKFWLYLLSSITMTGVVALWMAYISVSIPRVGGPSSILAGARPEKTAALASGRDSGAGDLLTDVGVRMSRGIALAKNLVKDYILGKPNTIEIKKSAENFILDSLPEIPANKLPE